MLCEVDETLIPLLAHTIPTRMQGNHTSVHHSTNRFGGFKGGSSAGIVMTTGLGFQRSTEASANFGHLRADTMNKGDSPVLFENTLGMNDFERMANPSSTGQGPSFAQLLPPGEYLDNLGAVRPVTNQEECVLTSSIKGQNAYNPEGLLYSIQILGVRKTR